MRSWNDSRLKPLIGVLFSVFAFAETTVARFQITEFLAVNADGIQDADDEFSDWIEIRNLTDEPLNFAEWFLSDDPSNPLKWKAPSFKVPAAAHGIIYASGKNSHSLFQLAVHTNFSLSRSAGYLSLADPEGRVVQEIHYPDQRTDIAYGLVDGREDEESFLQPPTPGESNRAKVYQAAVGDTSFSVDRGFFTEPFEVEITVNTEGAEIRYTTDGEEPSGGSLFTGPVGELYTGPIRIQGTTTLRAAGFKDGHLASNVDTHTYIFPEQVIRQPERPEGFPDRWVDYPADYEMDPRVVDDAAYRDEIVEGLKSIPSLSIVMSVDDLFGARDGIYSRSTDRGDAWEREGSVELIHPDGARGFQENCGIRVHGFGWRSHDNTHKHSFRLEFRERYGKTKLDYKLFSDAPVERFDSIVLRSQGSKGWQDFRDPEQTQYLHDTFARDTARDMGKIDGHATYAHLYLNGLYWGLYNPVERPDADFAAEYFGGEAREYDAINRRTTTNEAIDGDLVAYNELIALAQKGVETLEDYEAIRQYLDVGDLIDYMLIHQYTTNRDGPEEFNSNNMRGVRKRELGAQFRFFGWDMEYSLWNVDRNININVAIPGSISFVYSKLRDFPEFRLRYADHARKHLFHGGALTPGKVLERWNRRSDEIFSALIGESARWGDAKRPARPFTRDVEWVAERRRLVEDYFPHRTEILIKQLRDAELYPEVSAPILSLHGVQISSSDRITMEAGTLFDPEPGEFLYTMDGSDPRVYGTGERAPGVAVYDRNGPGITVEHSAIIKARTLRDNEWSALTEATFVLAVSPTPHSLTISEIHYRPAPPNEAEIAAGFQRRSDFEFIELTNVGASAVDLRSLEFIRGLTLSFDHLNVLDLPSGASAVLVRDLEAFKMRYGNGILVLGQFERGKLNDAGETITLADNRSGEIIQEVAFDDAAPWPREADGDGLSLELLDPERDLGDPANWRASPGIGGSPGAFVPSESGDPGATPKASMVLTREETEGVDYWVLTVEGADAFTLEVSKDLIAWSSVETGFVPVGNGRFRSEVPVKEMMEEQRYVRLRISQ